MTEVEAVLACLAIIAVIIVAMEYTPNRYLDWALPLYVTLTIVTCCNYFYFTKYF